MAIHPYYVENRFIVPEAVGECVIYKREKETIVDNTIGVELIEGQDTFELKPLLSQYTKGRENVLRKLYPENYK